MIKDFLYENKDTVNDLTGKLSLEQLIAESTGKDGKGILPVEGEAQLSLENYSDDRLFVLAIEYDGEQHFRPVKFGGMSETAAKDNYKKQIYRDGIKNKLIASHPDEITHFIRFNGKDEMNSNSIKEKLLKGGIPKERL